MKLRMSASYLVGPLVLLLLFVAWEIYVRALEVSRFVLPPPSRVFTALGEVLRTPTIGGHFVVTLQETLSGFIIAIFAGVILGALIAKVRWIDLALSPIVIISQVVPKVALVPLFVLWFGFGMTSKVVVAAVLATFPILTNTVLGIKSVERGHHDVMSSLNVGPLTRFWELELRSSLPYVLTGMEVGIVLATIGAIVGEYLGGSKGLGAIAVAYMNAMQVDRLFAVIILLSSLGFALYLLTTLLRRFLIPWHNSAFARNAGA